MKNLKVAFSTKCWENDWEIILKQKFIKEMIERNNFNFDKKIVIINNVKNKNEVNKYTEICKNEKIIDNYYFINNYADKVLKYFNITKESFGKGYWYSIAELTEIFLYKDFDFLVHFSSDSILERKYNWTDKALQIFDKDKNIVIVNPCWNKRYWEAKKESIKIFDNYYLGQGFSDQCYMIRLSEFKDQIYNEKNFYSERYPKYADNLFEKRIDAWMRNNNKYRATLKNISYIHKNWTRVRKFIYKNIIL